MRKGYLSEIFVSFQGEGAHVGRRHLFIRMGGCNLRCRYCDTPASLERTPMFCVQSARDGPRMVANPVTVQDLAAHVIGAVGPGETVDGVALTGGEPLLQADFLAELLADDTLPRPRLLETSGILADQLRVVLPLIDVISMDLKLPSNTAEPPFWEEHARFLRLARDKVYVKILVDAGTALGEVEHAGQLVEQLARDVPVFLQPIADANGNIDVAEDTLRSFYTTVRRHVADVRVLPQTHKILGIP